jgi:hypothetical protein
MQNYINQIKYFVLKTRTLLKVFCVSFSSDVQEPHAARVAALWVPQVYSYYVSQRYYRKRNWDSELQITDLGKWCFCMDSIRICFFICCSSHPSEPLVQCFVWLSATRIRPDCCTYTKSSCEFYFVLYWSIHSHLRGDRISDYLIDVSSHIAVVAYMQTVT